MAESSGNTGDLLCNRPVGIQSSQLRIHTADTKLQIIQILKPYPGIQPDSQHKATFNLSLSVLIKEDRASSYETKLRRVLHLKVYFCGCQGFFPTAFGMLEI